MHIVVIIYNRFSIIELVAVLAPKEQVAPQIKFLSLGILLFHESYWILLSKNLLNAYTKKVVVTLKMMSNQALGVVSEVPVYDIPCYVHIYSKRRLFFIPICGAYNIRVYCIFRRIYSVEPTEL